MVRPAPPLTVKDKNPSGHWLSLQISASGKHNAQWTQALNECWLSVCYAMLPV